MPADLPFRIDGMTREQLLSEFAQLRAKKDKAESRVRELEARVLTTQEAEDVLYALDKEIEDCDELALTGEGVRYLASIRAIRSKLSPTKGGTQ